jgi:hypothetical protein
MAQRTPSGKNVNCTYCQKEFYVPRYRITTTKYCSRSCLAKGSLLQVKANCAVCSKEFTHISSRCNKAKYCSRKCFYKSRIGKGLTQYSCRHCDKKFNAPKSTNRKYCSKKCINKEQKKSFNPKFTTVRKQMLARGMINKCQKCGYDEVKEILGVHHKDKNRNNNKLENLMVLCPNCHSIEHHKHIAH